MIWFCGVNDRKENQKHDINRQCIQLARCQVGMYVRWERVRSTSCPLGKMSARQDVRREGVRRQGVRRQGVRRQGVRRQGVPRQEVHWQDLRTGLQFTEVIPKKP